MNRPYTPRRFQTQTNTRPAHWFHPLRRAHASHVLRFLLHHGCRIFLCGETYRQLERDTQLRRYQIDAALDDLFAFRVVDIRSAGGMGVVELLDAGRLK